MAKKKSANNENSPSLFDNLFASAPSADEAAPADHGVALVYEDGRRETLEHASAPEPAQDAPIEAAVEPAEPAEAAPAQDEAEEHDQKDRREDDQKDAEQIGSASPVAEAMSGALEEDGALVLARYASRAYLEYAMSVVKARALPEVSDGQKPVQRRILLDMVKMGLFEKKAVKSARVVGDVLGKYHPHGDQSVYDALVRMAQDFSLRYPLVVGVGNFGSRDGDSQAAMRYTETRLMPIAKLLLDELDQGAVDFVPNYDGNFEEPVELPAKLPFVLLNGASGIAVGMATEIPPHNLNEVAAACVMLLEKPEATLDEVMTVLPAPDFPCGGQIISSRREIRQIYQEGRGKLRVRARYHFEELARGQWQLVVDELPPAASAKIILDRIEQITNPKVKKDKKTLSAKQQQSKAAMLAVLDRVRDESGGDVDVRLVFEPKSSRVDRDQFVNLLLTETDLESNVPVNFVMIGIDKKPRQKPLLSVLKEWIDFRLKTVRRRSETRLAAVDDRLHVLEGRQRVLLNIDRVIEIIRENEKPKEPLMAEFGLSDRQAEDILNMRLRALSKLAALEIEAELAKLGKEKAELERVLGSDGVLKRLVIKEIRAAAKEFGDERRTLVEEAQTAVLEQSVVNEPVTVVISKKGYLRSRTGHGHDCTLMNFKMGDELLTAVECRTADTLAVVDTHGRVYSIAVANLPGARTDGMPLSAFIELEKNAEPIAYFAGDPKMEILFAATDGMGLVASLGDIATRLKAGRLFMKLGEGQSLLKAVSIGGASKAACLSGGGRLLVFSLEEIRRLPSGGKGVALMTLEPGEKLLDIAAVDDRGVIVSGTGRGGQPREQIFAKSKFANLTLKRARKGRALEISWRAERVRALPSLSADDSEGASGLKLEEVEESTTLF